MRIEFTSQSPALDGVKIELPLGVDRQSSDLPTATTIYMNGKPQEFISASGSEVHRVSI